MMAFTWQKLHHIISFNIIINLIGHAGGHGRLLNPPARNSMWRFGFANPVNYDDNELYCGGYAVQWEQNKGKCGLCGDAYNMQQKPHEAGGEYANGIITKRYVAGQKMEVEIELTANHFGWFELRLCPNNNPKVEAKQKCLDKYPLYIVGRKTSKYLIPENTKDNSTFRYSVQLPPHLTCTQCVLQWTYYTGNMWGVCANGEEAVGCGNPETFRNCADISIVSNTASGVSPRHVGKTRKKGFISNRQKR